MSDERSKLCYSLNTSNKQHKLTPCFFQPDRPIRLSARNAAKHSPVEQTSNDTNQAFTPLSQWIARWKIAFAKVALASHVATISWNICAHSTTTIFPSVTGTGSARLVPCSTPDFIAYDVTWYIVLLHRHTYYDLMSQMLDDFMTGAPPTFLFYFSSFDLLIDS